MKIGRNDLCPCGSGKKFKKCHLGREDELSLEGAAEITEEVSRSITSLPEVDYGRCREMAEGLDIEGLTGLSMGVKFVDLRAYRGLSIHGDTVDRKTDVKRGGVFINTYKTRVTDPDSLYLAVSKGIDDSSLVHQLAHVLDYLAGSRLMAGTLDPLGYEFDVPVEHLEHTEEFGYWLSFLKDRFGVRLDADDAIIDFLYASGRLLKGEVVRKKRGSDIRAASEGILRFLAAHSSEVDALIRDREGYIGPRDPGN